MGGNFRSDRILSYGCELYILPTLGVVTASPEAATSAAKIDVAIFGWFWLIVESGNILLLQRPLRGNSFATEVKKVRMEAFACEFFISRFLFLSLCS